MNLGLLFAVHIGLILKQLVPREDDPSKGTGSILNSFVASNFDLSVTLEHTLLIQLIVCFEFYFPTKDDPLKGTVWIPNPFVASNFDLSVTLEDTLLM